MSSALNLPDRSKDVIDRLTRGYHLSIEDGEDYADVQGNVDAYRELFDAMSLRLSDGKDGIFYLLPREGAGISEPSKRLVVFIAIFTEWLADQGKDTVYSLMNECFDVRDLPHLKEGEYRHKMDMLDMGTEEKMLRAIKNLETFGFLTLIDNELIRFRKPVSRFFFIFDGLADEKHIAEGDE